MEKIYKTNDFYITIDKLFGNDNVKVKGVSTGKVVGEFVLESSAYDDYYLFQPAFRVRFDQEALRQITRLMGCL